MGKPRSKPNYRRRVLRLPDLDHCKSAVLNSLGWAFNRTVVVRYRLVATVNFRLARRSSEITREHHQFTEDSASTILCSQPQHHPPLLPGSANV